MSGRILGHGVFSHPSNLGGFHFLGKDKGRKWGEALSVERWEYGHGTFIYLTYF